MLGVVEPDEDDLFPSGAGRDLRVSLPEFAVGQRGFARMMRGGQSVSAPFTAHVADGVGS